jgi:hypothetical protein
MFLIKISGCYLKKGYLEDNQYEVILLQIKSKSFCQQKNAANSV